MNARRPILLLIAWAVILFSTVGVSNIKHGAVCNYIETNQLTNAQPNKYYC